MVLLLVIGRSNREYSLVPCAFVVGKYAHANYGTRYPKIWYTAEGRELSKRAWEETMEELNFAGASKIVEEMRTG